MIFLKGNPMNKDEFAEMRERMVTEQIEARGVREARVLAALRAIPRHLFVSPEFIASAYDDCPLPIGHNQTISQPYIVGLMTELARIKETDTVLEIGTGSGYQAAVLCALAAQVVSIDIIPELIDDAENKLRLLGYNNIKLLCADGYKGAPVPETFDAILVTAAPPEIPKELIRPLKPGGRLVIPVGKFSQELLVLTKKREDTVSQETIIPVRFVPMVHEKHNA